MSQLCFTIKGQELLISTPKVIVSDTVRYIHAKFSFNDEWKGLKKWAHFENKGTIYDFLINENDEITIDQHLDLMDGRWSVSVHGDDISNNELHKRITTTTVDFRVVRAMLNGEPFPSVTPSAAEQIMIQIISMHGEVLEKAEQVATDSDIASKAALVTMADREIVVTKAAEVEHNAGVAVSAANSASKDASDVSSMTRDVTKKYTRIVQAETNVLSAKDTIVEKAQEVSTNAVSAATDAKTAKSYAESAVNSEKVVVEKAAEVARNTQASAEYASTTRQNATTVTQMTNTVQNLHDQVVQDAKTATEAKTVIVEKAAQVADDSSKARTAAEAAKTSETRAAASEASAKTYSKQTRTDAEQVRGDLNEVTKKATQVRQDTTEVASNTNTVRQLSTEVNQNARTVAENTEIVQEIADHIPPDYERISKETVIIGNGYPDSEYNRIRVVDVVEEEYMTPEDFDGTATDNAALLLVNEMINENAILPSIVDFLLNLPEDDALTAIVDAIHEENDILRRIARKDITE